MEMMKLKWQKSLILIATLATCFACSNDPEVTGTGEVQFEITDAPVDDANVKGVFVTVADVKVGGTSLQGFSKQTIDLTAFQEGNTKILGVGQFDAKTYQGVTLVLDVDKDENGGSPGCYVLDQNNSKYQLKTTANGTLELSLNKPWTVVRDAKNNIVLDFDLRKSIRHADGLSAYSFVSDDNLRAAVNVVTKAKTGIVKGSYQETSNSNADKIIVYAYKKGTFNAATETTPQGEDQIMFANARSSAVVKQTVTGNVFTLAFLEEGEYELYFTGYQHDAATDRYIFKGQLQSETSIDGSVSDLVTVRSGLTINVIANITGVL